MTAQWWLGFHVSCPTLFMAVLWAACSWINPQSIDWAHYKGPRRSEKGVKNGIFPLEEVHFHLNEGGSLKRVVFRARMCEMCWFCSRRLLGTARSAACSRVISAGPLIYTPPSSVAFFVATYSPDNLALFFCFSWCTFMLSCVHLCNVQRNGFLPLKGAKDYEKERIDSR